MNKPKDFDSRTGSYIAQELISARREAASKSLGALQELRLLIKTCEQIEEDSKKVAEAPERAVKTWKNKYGN